MRYFSSRLSSLAVVLVVSLSLSGVVWSSVSSSDVDNSNNDSNIRTTATPHHSEDVNRDIDTDAAYYYDSVDATIDVDVDVDDLEPSAVHVNETETTDLENETETDNAMVSKPSMRGSGSTSSSSDSESSSNDEASPDAVVKEKKKVRKHQLVRRGRVGTVSVERQAQQCNLQCFNNQGCIDWGNSYPNCRQFNRCNNGICQQNSFATCNSSCSNDSNCRNASGGCTSCVNFRCQVGNRGFTNKCNWNCRNNFNICNDSSNGCTRCNGSTCQAVGQPRCGQFCRNNPNICIGATDGCTECNGSTGTCSGNRSFTNKCGWNCSRNFNICNDSSNGCTTCNGSTCQAGGNRGNARCGQFCRNNPSICNDAIDGCNRCNGDTCTSGGAQTCNSGCFNNNDCINALNGCTTCIGGTCQGNRNIGGSCVASEAALRARLEGGGTIELCSNANIVVNSEITTSRSNVVLRCFGGGTGCTIRGGGSNRLIRFTGQSITLQGVTFQGGSATGAGGAIAIDGNNNRITNCSFNSNRASQQGGAGSVGSTTFAGNTFAGNFAAQCTNFYQKSTGQCFGT